MTCSTQWKGTCKTGDTGPQGLELPIPGLDSANSRAYSQHNSCFEPKSIYPKITHFFGCCDCSMPFLKPKKIRPYALRQKCTNYDNRKGCVVWRLVRESAENVSRQDKPEAAWQNTKTCRKSPKSNVLWILVDLLWKPNKVTTQQKKKSILVM